MHHRAPAPRALFTFALEVFIAMTINKTKSIAVNFSHQSYPAKGKKELYPQHLPLKNKKEHTFVSSVIGPLG